MSHITIADELAARARASGITMKELCRRTKTAQSTPSRWKAGAEPKPSTVRRMEEELERIEAEKAMAA